MAAGQRAVKFKAGLQRAGRASLSLVIGVFCFRQLQRCDPCTLHSVESGGENHSISATCSWLVKVTHVRLLGAESASPRTEAALIPDCPVLKYPEVDLQVDPKTCLETRKPHEVFHPAWMLLSVSLTFPRLGITWADLLGFPGWQDAASCALAVGLKV